MLLAKFRDYSRSLFCNTTTENEPMRVGAVTFFGLNQPEQDRVSLVGETFRVEHSRLEIELALKKMNEERSKYEERTGKSAKIFLDEYADEFNEYENTQGFVNMPMPGSRERMFFHIDDFETLEISTEIEDKESTVIIRVAGQMRESTYGPSSHGEDHREYAEKAYRHITKILSTVARCQEES